ncbi:hypothetical protein, partial [Fusobacterium sp.]|uniref:hypothetical protein n=1 Tax=Fusobacterium sp. TaxID=68766 RepID=UPI0026213080
MKFLNIMWKKIEELFKGNFEDIFMISIFNFFLYGINRHFYGRFVHSPFFIKLMKFSLGYIEFLTICIGIGIIFSFFGEKIKNIFFKIIKYISFIIFITEFFLFINFKSIINPGIIQILLETNKNESIDFVREYLKLNDILCLIILFFIIQIFYKILIKKINIDRVFKIKFLRIVLILFILISIFNIRKNFNKT